MKNKSKNHAVDSNKCEDSIRLRGWDIRCVDKGLDEAQVRSIITELISQRNELAKKMGNISALHEQAKKTVIEADEFANELKTEALKNINSEQTKFRTEIEESTQQLRAEGEKIPVELSGVVDRISRELTSIKEEFSKQVGTVWADCEGRLNALVTTENDKKNAKDQGEDPSLKYRPRKYDNLHNKPM